MIRKVIQSIVIIGFSLFLVACGSNENEEKKPVEQPVDQEVLIDKEEQIDNDEVVLSVDGSDITGDMYNIIYAQTKIEMKRYEQDISDLDELKEFTIEALINQELLRQVATEAGINVSDEELDAEFEAIKSENESQFISFLEMYNLTEDIFKDQLQLAIFHDKYVDSEMVIEEATNEEITKAYEELQANNTDVPQLADIEEQLKQQLQAQKQQEALQNKLTKLREEVTIEKYLS